jgi:hypothetical protein
MKIINLARICVNVNTGFKLKEFQGFVKNNIRVLAVMKKSMNRLNVIAYKMIWLGS